MLKAAVLAALALTTEAVRVHPKREAGKAASKGGLRAPKAVTERIRAAKAGRVAAKAAAATPTAVPSAFPWPKFLTDSLLVWTRFNCECVKLWLFN